MEILNVDSADQNEKTWNKYFKNKILKMTTRNTYLHVFKG